VRLLIWITIYMPIIVFSAILILSLLACLIHPSALAAIRLLLLTGARKSEILTLKWEQVDLERYALRLPDSKTGAKVIALGGPAAALLARLDRCEGNPYVCWANSAGS